MWLCDHCTAEGAEIDHSLIWGDNEQTNRAATRTNSNRYRDRIETCTTFAMVMDSLVPRPCSKTPRIDQRIIVCLPGRRRSKA